jgi:hypothetical protein
LEEFITSALPSTYKPSSTPPSWHLRSGLGHSFHYRVRTPAHNSVFPSIYLLNSIPAHAMFTTALGILFEAFAASPIICGFGRRRCHLLAVLSRGA